MAERIPVGLLDAKSVRATILNDYVSFWCDQTGWSLQLHIDNGGRELLKQLGLPAPDSESRPGVVQTDESDPYIEEV